MAGEIIIKCPFCEDHPLHNHCYINADKLLFHCFYCGKGGSLKTLVREFPHLKAQVLSSIDWSAFGKGREWQVKKFSPLLNENMTQIQSNVLDYLERRGMTLEEIVACRVLYSHEMRNRAVFPDITGGPEIFWTARSVLSESPKWLFPSSGATKMEKAEYVWGLDKIRQGEDIWVAEGVFDALAVRGVAILGKTPTPLQLSSLLSKRPRRIILAFDSDALDDAKKVQHTLRSLVPTGVEIPPKPHKDFGEVMMKTGWRRA